MTAPAYDYDISFSTVDCCSCHGSFLMTATAIRNLKKTKKGFYCPYCGTVQGWYGDNEEDRLKKQLEAEKNGRELAERRATRAQVREGVAKLKASAQKGVATRLKNRAKAGVCPCCTRTFKQLAAHMKNKHPEYTEEKK